MHQYFSKIEHFLLNVLLHTLCRFPFIHNNDQIVRYQYRYFLQNTYLYKIRFSVHFIYWSCALGILFSGGWVFRSGSHRWGILGPTYRGIQAEMAMVHERVPLKRKIGRSKAPCIRKVLSRLELLLFFVYFFLFPP